MFAKKTQLFLTLNLTRETGFHRDCCGAPAADVSCSRFSTTISQLALN